MQRSKVIRLDTFFCFDLNVHGSCIIYANRDVLAAELLREECDVAAELKKRRSQMHAEVGKMPFAREMVYGCVYTTHFPIA